MWLSRPVDGGTSLMALTCRLATASLRSHTKRVRSKWPSNWWSSCAQFRTAVRYRCDGSLETDGSPGRAHCLDSFGFRVQGECSPRYIWEEEDGEAEVPQGGGRYCGRRGGGRLSGPGDLAEPHRMADGHDLAQELSRPGHQRGETRQHHPRGDRWAAVDHGLWRGRDRAGLRELRRRDQRRGRLHARDALLLAE